MNFEFLNIHTVEPLVMKITFRNQVVKFYIGNIIQRNNKEELSRASQFQVLTDYLNYKGEEFKDELFTRYITLQELYDESLITGNDTQVNNELMKLMDMFDVIDISIFLNTYQYINPPASLPEKIDETVDGSFKRSQTYTKSEYYDLAALTIVSKFMIGPYGEYSTSMSHKLQTGMLEFSIFNIIKRHELFKSEPAQKLLGLAENIYEAASVMTYSIIMTKLLPESEIPNWLMATIFLKKMPINDLTKDNSSKNIITNAYNAANNSLKNNTNVASKIRDKSPTSDGEETESVIEQYRMTSELAPGTVEEFNWVLSDPYFQLDYLGLNDYANVLEDALKFTEIMRNKNVMPIATVHLISNVLDELLDPRAFWHVRIDGMVNALCIAFTYLWSKDMHELALLLTAMEIETDIMTISQTVSRTKVTKDTLDTLDSYYHTNKIVETRQGITTKNPVTSTIRLLSDMYYKSTFIYAATKKYTGDRPKMVEVPSNLKQLLAEFFILKNKIEIN